MEREASIDEAIRDGPLSRHSEKISIDQTVGANMASSEIVEYAALYSTVLLQRTI